MGTLEVFPLTAIWSSPEAIEQFLMTMLVPQTSMPSVFGDSSGASMVTPSIVMSLLLPMSMWAIGAFCSRTPRMARRVMRKRLIISGRWDVRPTLAERIPPGLPLP